jgi:hypothetical protein
VGAANGLARKQIAPAFSARARTLSSGKAVMKMNGTAYPWARIWLSSSRPLMADICTSAITHDESFRRADCKNSSADANVWIRYPCDLMMHDRPHFPLTRKKRLNALAPCGRVVASAKPFSLGGCQYHLDTATHP